MSERTERIREWAGDLTEAQMRIVLVGLMEIAMDAEMVAFPELAPYWEHSGEPLVEGQKTFVGA